jgi:ABC-type amino acid transport substrate-binding protein
MHKLKNLKTPTLLLVLLAACGIFMLNVPQVSTAQGDLTTLVPPTLFPPSATATPFPQITQSAIARIKGRINPANNKIVTVIGIPYNTPPFSELNENGEVVGFEADLALAIAEDWGTELELKQVTTQSGLRMLQTGEIDLLMGQVVVTRDESSPLDFSTPYFIGKQVALAMADDPIASVTELGDKNVGVVIGSRSETAFNEWVQANGMNVNTIGYAMLDDALRALYNREITAIVGDRWELDMRVSRRFRVEGLKLIGNDVFRSEPYAVGMLRYDAPLRSLVNRTLQRIQANGRLNAIYNAWFPEDLMPLSDRVEIPVWGSLDADQRTIADFQTDIVVPSQSVLERIRTGQPIRVAGMGAPALSNGQPNPMDAFGAAIVNEMARRWGVPVEFVPNTFTNAEDTLASGAADIAVSLEPRWGSVDRFDYIGVYAVRGYRMVMRVGSEVRAFGDMGFGRRAVGTFADDPNAFEIARRLMKSVGIPENQISNQVYDNEQEALNAVFERQSSRVLFGDMFRLVPMHAANDAQLDITDRLYEPRPIAMAVPLNDAAFRLLVEATLQDMWQDGTYDRLWAEQYPYGEPLNMIVYPGAKTLFGIRTTG